MSVGFEEAARRSGHMLEIPLAADTSEEARRAFEANLPFADFQVANVTQLFDGPVGARLTKSERQVLRLVGEVDLLIGGPPCQGHSSLNNHTRGQDPKNALYLRMGRAAEVLVPKVVVIENVVEVLRDFGRVVDATAEALVRSGYDVDGAVLDLARVGVPQRRRRHFLLASRASGISPGRVLASVVARMAGHSERTVRWAIQDLLGVRSGALADSASVARADNRRRIDYLFDNGLYDLPNTMRPRCHRDREHSYSSMYGRLAWDRPAQTITSGFGSMGQGRFVHPEERRTLTPHEAARLQTFPDWYRFDLGIGRGRLAEMIGNAVPPLATLALGLQILPELKPATRRAGRT